MASKTQLRLSQLTGSMPSSSDSAAAPIDILGNDLGKVLDTMASAIKRIHGGTTFSQANAGVFALDIIPDADGSRDLGSTSAEFAEVHANKLESQDGLDIDAGSALSLDGAGGINIGTAANVAVDFHASTLDIDATGAVSIDSTASVILQGATGAGIGDDTESLAFDGSGNVDFDAVALDIDASGAITMDTTAGMSLDAAASSNLTVTGASSSGADVDLVLKAANNDSVYKGNIDMDADGDIAIDAAETVSIDAAGASNFSTSSGDLTLNASSSSGKVVVKGDHASGVAIHLDANQGSSSEIHMEAGVLDMDATGAATLDAGGSISLTGAGINLDGGSTEIDITSTGAVDINSAAFTVDGSSVSIDGTDAMNFSMSANSSSNLTLDIDAANSGGGTAGIRVGTTSGTAVVIGASTSQVTIGDNLIVSGDLTVQGDTTTVDTTNLLVEDPVILLASGASSSDQNGGIVIEKGGSNTDEDMVFGRVAANTWGVGTLDTSGGTATSLASMSLQPLRAGKLEIDSASDYIDIASGNLAIVAGSSSTDILLDPAGSDVKVDGNLVPNSDDGGTLGSANLNWSDMYLADAAVLNFGDDQDVQLLHVEDAGLRLNAGMQLQFRDADIHISSDADGALEARADSQIDLKIGSNDIASVRSGGLMPGLDNGRALGATSLAWSDLYLGDGAVLRFGPSSYGATLTHSKVDRFGDDIKDDRLTGSFSAFQTSRIIGSTLSSSDSSISMSPEVGTSLASGDVIVFNDSSSNKLAFTVSSSVSSGDSSISVSFNSDASTSGTTSMSVSSISSVSKDFGAVKSAPTSSSLTDGMSSLTFASGDAASAFNSKIGSNGTVVFVDGGITATLVLGSYSSGSSITLDSASLSGGSSLSPSSSDSIKVKASDQAQKMTLDGNYTSFNIVDHDGSAYGLELAGTLVTATAAELNLLDGGSSTESVTLAGSDGFIVNDSGTMKLARISDMASFFSSNRTKKSVTLTAAVSAGNVATITDMVHDFGADPDITDVYLNGQLMLSGSSASNGDYRINGTGPDSSVSVSANPNSPSTFSSSTTSVGFDSGLGSGYSSFAAGKVLVLENSAGTKRFEGVIASTPSGNSATSISITSGTARVFNPQTGAAVTDFASSEVGSSGKRVADALTSDDIVFFFALEADDVITMSKNG